MSLQANRHTPRPQRQGGYVLLMVMSALAVIAFVALRFAERTDQLRRTALELTDYAAGLAEASGAQAATLYWMSTRPLQPGGYGVPGRSLRADATVYQLDSGALVSVQDQRGLLSVNAMNRPALLNLLVQDGLPVDRAMVMLDVLEDYLDTDNLKRLNGAELPEYEALGLAAPRNDWLLSLRELENMPLWRDDQARLSRLTELLTTQITNQFNPITAPAAVLRAIFPVAAPAQMDLLLTLRRGDLLTSGLAATRMTGLDMDREDYWFAPGYDSRVRVWAHGLPRALEYNTRLTPAGATGPWIITEQHSASRLRQRNEPSAASSFPLPLAASYPDVASGAAAP